MALATNIRTLASRRWGPLYGYLVSLAMLLTVLTLFATGSIRGRWNAFGGMLWYLAALPIWFGWVVHLGWLLFRGKRSWKRGLSSAVVLVLCAGVSYFLVPLATRAGAVARARDVRASIDAGLVEDCSWLIDNWPGATTGEGLRMSRGEEGYEALPASTKMLEAGYITHYRHAFGFSEIPHIGICTNGFGGFAQGLRVFRSEEDARRYMSEVAGRYERIAPGVYVCWHST